MKVLVGDIGGTNARFRLLEEKAISGVCGINQPGPALSSNPSRHYSRN